MIKTVNRKAWQAAAVLVLLVALIVLLAWLLFTFGSYLLSLVS